MAEDSAKSKAGFEKFAERVTRATGSSAAFMLAVGFVLGWAITGPFFHFSDTWELVINTSTTIITFLMVFLIQKSQNKESKAIQLKLNELIAANRHASNRLVGAENLTEEELHVLQRHYQTMASITQQASNLRRSHSVEEAIDNSLEKLNEP